MGIPKASTHMVTVILINLTARLSRIDLVFRVASSGQDWAVGKVLEQEQERLLRQALHMSLC